MFSNVFSSVCDLMIIFFLVFSCDHVISCTHHTGTNIFFLFFFSGLLHVAAEVWFGSCAKSNLVSIPHCFRELTRIAMAGRPPAGVPLVPGLPRRVIKVIHCAEANIPRIKFEPVSVSHNQVNIRKINSIKYLLINFTPRGLGSARAASLPPDGLLCNYTTHLCHGQRLQGYEFCIR